MELTESALRTVRDALDSYKATRRNGRELSWHEIAESLCTDGFLPDPADDDDDDDHRGRYPYKQLAEALRRFVSGSQVLGSERLQAVTRYLMEKKFLSAEVIQRAEPQPLLLSGLRSFFGGEFGPAQFQIRLPGTYFAVRKIGGRVEVSVLRIDAEDDGVYPAAQTVYSLHTEPLSFKADALLRLLKVSGGSAFRYQGYLVRARRQYCMFLRDDTERESSVDLLLRLYGDPKGTEMTVARSRDFGPGHDGYVRPMTIIKQEDDIALAGVKDRVWRYKARDAHEL